uniref:Fatty acyl-CoA synthase n=1 Tax=Starmerella bombicola TaxID=75736 RepID=A0A5J6CUM0_STABO|nr:fatty acyl-CoA synthase [Starmerella bombicola]
MFSVQVDKPQRAGETGSIRNSKAADKPSTCPAGTDIKTVHELVSYGIETFGDSNFLGQREFIKLHTETREVTKKVDGEDKKVKKDWQYFEMGKFDWETYRELEQTRKKLGSAMVKCGIKPGEGKMHLYAKTCREWMQTAVACASQNITLVTAYDTLGIEGLRESINQTETSGILLDKGNLSNLSKVLQDAPSIKFVVYRDSEGELSDANKKEIESFAGYNGGIKVYSYTEFLKLGEENPVEYHAPKADDICCIMYTSGSTGPPKGVTLLHSTVVAGVAGATGNVTRKSVSSTDVFLAILPLAHIFEFTAELAVFYWGSAIGYGSPKTITDTNMRNCKGDMRELQPTILVGVPAVFEAIKKGISGQISKAPVVSQKVFWGAFKLKQTLLSLHLPVPLLDSVIFKKIKDATGGRLRFVMNGGAPVSAGTRTFINVLLAPLIMGYGLTETNAMCAILNPLNLDMDSTGEIVTSVTIKLVDVPDTGYFAKNNQGEIWVKGPAVSPGYWKNEKETKEAYTEDGWFKTGDIGELTKNGKIRIVDRKKNLIKTLNGEYVAVERLESLYRSNKYVSNICVFADSSHAKPVAIVCPVESAIKDLCSAKGLQYSESVIHEKSINGPVLESLHATAKECNLRPVEWLAGVALSDEEWTPQNGFVTSAQKVQRKKIGTEYKKQLDEIFKNA